MRIKEPNSISIDLLEMLGIVVVTTWVMTVARGERPEKRRESVLMRGDNESALQ